MKREKNSLTDLKKANQINKNSLFRKCIRLVRKSNQILKSVFNLCNMANQVHLTKMEMGRAMLKVDK